MRKLRIAIATSGRFHVLDLARELHALGHDVRFYSYVPKRRAMVFALPGKCHVSLLPFLWPFLAWQVIAPVVLPKLRERWMWVAMNWAVKLRLQRCDVFIFMSGMYLEAAEYARARYGARLIIERGSKHILEQKQILLEFSNSILPSEFTIKREIKGYELADVISVPSSHVERSFRRYQGCAQKMLKNCYGVDLQDFAAIERQPPSKNVTFIFVGNWCQRKGCPPLIDAIRRNSRRHLLHVGDITDCPFPKGDAQFEHVDKVDQKRLRGFYAMAHAFVLPSREEGMAMVMLQALATGLPLLCTIATGAEDLAFSDAFADRIQVISSANVDDLSEGMNVIARRLIDGPPYVALCSTDRDKLSWAAYGERYGRFLDERVIRRMKST